MTSKTRDYIITVIGIFLLTAGLFFNKSLPDSNSFIRSLPYVLIGLGCGVFGHGMGSIISRTAIRYNPDIQKQIEIEKNDERNIAIANSAKARSYDMMIFVYGALMLSFALMEVKLTMMLLLVFAYLFVVGYGIYYRCKYEKEM